MKRADGLYDISRRDLCVIGGLGGLAIACGCTDDGTGAIQTGGLGTDLPPDAGAAHHVDAGMVTSGDGSTTGACTGSPTDVGEPSTFVAGTPKYFSTGNFYVVRDAGGLYALTAKCTHDGATTCIGTSNNCSASGTEFYCPRHGATFSFLGTATTGPAFLPLVHYSMCLMASGHAGVTTTVTVSQTTRLDA